jgi:carotenoid cleavage dioxygenase-like enzyme
MTTQSDEAARLPFHLTGNYAPVLEELTATELQVQGRLPAELKGTYVRNGPNPRDGPTPMWFLGQGMLHGVRLENGQALWYRNRWINAPSTSNTSIVRHAGRMLALVETATPIEVDPLLSTVGPFDFAGGLARGMTAHPKTCPGTGELFFFAYGLEAPFLIYYRADRDGRLLQTEHLQVGAPTYMHDFAITERFALFFDLPLIYSGWRSPAPVRWSDEYGARIGVLPRVGNSNELRWFDIEPCTISHTVNAYEDDDTIVLDVVRGRRLGEPTNLTRYVLDLRTGKADETVLDSLYLEFPRIDDRRTGSRHRYFYALELRNVVNGAPMESSLLKYDTRVRTAIAHDFGPDRVAGECTFVPRAGGAEEDDGYGLCYVYDRRRNFSELVVLDARDFQAPPLATVELPVRVPFGIHGDWFPDTAR